MKHRIKQSVPRPLRSAMRTLYGLAADGWSELSGQRDRSTPPKRKSMLFVGGGDYKQTGDEFFRYFTELGGLRPTDSVLDIGCGIGRMAMPLTSYLRDGGRYEGFDIVDEGVRWCREHITSQHPNFHFQVADIYNKEYNPKGKQSAAEYTFPYDDSSFDFTFLISVFTHMLPAEVERYLSEIARTLKPGGRCLCTFFLLNPESCDLIDARAGILNFLDFKYECGVYRTIDKHAPEAAVAYDENYVRALYSTYGLRIVEPIRYGAWCGRQEYLSGQDIVIAAKNGPEAT